MVRSPAALKPQPKPHQDRAGKAALLPPPANIAWVALGGAIGAGLRFALNEAFPASVAAFPWVTLFENVAGAFLLALMLTYVLRRRRLRWDVRPFLGTGLLGSFTTFSTLSHELLTLAPAAALGYALVSLLLGLLAAFAGISLAGKGRY